MTSWVGTALLLLASSCALATAVAGAGRRAEVALATAAAAASAAAASVVLLAGALLAPDFSVAHVADHGARDLPVRDRITTVWAGADGSLLLWCAVLLTVTAVLAAGVRRAPSAGQGWRAVALLAALAGCFTLVLVLTANPFATVAPPPADGPGPNPLLRGHAAMSVHPPLLYLGFACTAPAFVLALTARDRRWVREAVPWMRASWTFLTAAILLGAWWSWSVLGWGGYWAWDPVENLALLPWLIVTAFLHAIHAGPRDDSRLVHGCALAAFVLVLTAVTLTRSGAVLSIHSFAESAQGPPLLVLLGAVVVTVVVRSLVVSPPHVRPVRPTGSAHVVRLAVVVLSLAAAAVLVGTLYPLGAEAVGGPHGGVGPTYYETVLGPVLLVLVALLPLHAAVRRGGPNPRAVVRALAPSIAAAAISMVGARLVGVDRKDVLVLLGLLAAAGTATVVAPRRSVTGRRAGVVLAHVGVLVLVGGATISSTYAEEGQFGLAEGESGSAAGITLRLDELRRAQDDRSMQTTAVLESGGSTFQPALTYDRAHEVVVSTADSRPGWTATRQVTLLSADVEAGRVELAVRRDPLLVWMWSGGAAMVLGGVVGIATRRRRSTGVAASAPRSTSQEVLV